MYILYTIVLYLFIRNLAFRGEIDQLSTPNNGNVLRLEQLISKYDFTMHGHARCSILKQTSVSYCSKITQNEITSTITSCARGKILERDQQAKYCSITLDCTPRMSYREQLSFKLRFVNVCEDYLVFQEHFITFHEREGQQDVLHSC